MTSNAKGALLALLAFAVYATHDVVVKLLGETYSPFQLIFFSVLFSFPLALILLMRDQTPGTLLPVHPWWVGFRTIAALITGISAFYAFTTLDLAQVYAILFASPLLITVLAIPMLGEKVGVRRGLAVLVGLAGVMVVLRPGSADLELGHVAALVAAFGAAFASIIVRKIGAEERPVVLLLYPMIGNFILMACALPFVYVPVPIEHLGLFAVVALFGTAGGLIIIAAYRAGEAVIVAPMQYSQIIWATVFGIFVFNEYPDQGTVIGAAIIIASGLYIVLRESIPGRSQNTPVLRTKPRPDTGTAPREARVPRGRLRPPPAAKN